jgi:hypothetical protein
MPDAIINRGVGRAWLALCFALAAHVFDEAATGFLVVYNPTVMGIRERVSWFPMPVFTFGGWLTGLSIVIAALFAVSALVYRGARGTRLAACVFAIVMTANAFGHTAATIFGRTIESVRFVRPAPGFYSSPLLLAASVYLLIRLRSSRLA